MSICNFYNELSASTTIDPCIGPVRIFDAVLSPANFCEIHIFVRGHWKASDSRFCWNRDRHPHQERAGKNKFVAQDTTLWFTVPDDIGSFSVYAFKGFKKTSHLVGCFFSTCFLRLLSLLWSSCAPLSFQNCWIDSLPFARGALWGMRHWRMEDGRGKKAGKERLLISCERRGILFQEICPLPLCLTFPLKRLGNLLQTPKTPGQRVANCWHPLVSQLLCFHSEGGARQHDFGGQFAPG